MKNKIPKVVKDLLKKYKVYYQCCDICDIKCCNGHTIFTINGVKYIVDTSGVTPTLTEYTGNRVVSCVVNISSITTDPRDEDRWILGTEGTTADGYVNLIFDAGGALVIPNPNGDIYSIEMSEAFIETLPSALTISRSLSATGSPICSNIFTIQSFRDDVEIPEIGADTIYPIADIVGLPTCGGTISYYLISNASALCSLNTVTGEMTITAGALVFDNYAFIAQICTTGGLPSVLSVVGLLIANP